VVSVRSRCSRRSNCPNNTVMIISGIYQQKNMFRTLLEHDALASYNSRIKTLNLVSLYLLITMYSPWYSINENMK
jgi:hypothetical protein